MLETLAQIAEYLVRGVRYYKSRRTAVRRKAFGRSLATCYLRLIEITATGRQLIDELERCDRRFREHPQKKDDGSLSNAGIRDLLLKQGLNLSRLGSELKTISCELAILAPPEAYQLATLVNGKRNFVWQLIQLLDAGRYAYAVSLPKPPMDAALRRFLIECGAAKAWNKRSAEALIAWAEHGEYMSLPTRDIDATVKWDGRVYRRIHAYLESEAPRQALEKLSCYAEQLRAALVANFSLDEILWTVSDFHDHRRVFMM